jgi:hypothetical protein
MRLSPATISRFPYLEFAHPNFSPTPPPAQLRELVATRRRTCALGLRATFSMEHGVFSIVALTTLRACAIFHLEQSHKLRRRMPLQRGTHQWGESPEMA